VEVPTHRPKATETMDRIVEVTARLIDRGLAYESGGDVFFSVRKFDGYGKLSGKKIDELESGARVSVDERKEDPLDFALWKASKPGEPAWESPWGPGRPGWHIECSAMCMEWLGETIDIHGGGKDLIFPHHENEIAQSEGASGTKPFVRYWLHNGFVNIEREKMSKSIGNILNIRDALEASTSEAVRFFLLSSHYRSPIDYSADSLKEAEAAVERIYKTLERIGAACPEGVEQDEQEVAERILPFTGAMDDDFNTAEAIGALFKEATRANKILDECGGGGEGEGVTEEAGRELSLIRAVFARASTVLGLFGRHPEEYFNDRRKSTTVPTAEIERLIDERNAARKGKDFQRADAIRAELLDKGVVLEDTPKGTVWTVR
jgi:cysteinyl-tRNA synthetase